MGSVLFAVLCSVIVALVLSFAAYGVTVFALACRQKRQSAEYRTWSEAWAIVTSQWRDRRNGIAPTHLIDDTESEHEAAMSSEFPFPRAPRRATRKRTTTKSSKPTRPRTRRSK